MAAVEYPTVGALVDLVQSEAYQAIALIRDESLVRSVAYVTDPAELG